MKVPVLALLHASLLVLAAQAQVGTQTDLLFGHYGLSIEYDPTVPDANEGWSFWVSYDKDGTFEEDPNNPPDPGGIVRYDPETIRIVATPGTRTTIGPNVPPMAEPGHPLWLLPSTRKEGQMYLGVRSLISPGVFQTFFNGFPINGPGSFALEMTQVDRPPNSNLAIWERGLFTGIDLHFDTTENTTSPNVLPELPGLTHTHYNIGMTEPGVYKVTFQASAVIHPGQPNAGQLATGSDVYTFVVPFSGYRTGTAEFRPNDSAEIPVALYHGTEDCEYLTDHIALVTESQTHAGTPQPFGFTLNFAEPVAIAPNRVGIDKDLALALPANTTLGAPPFSIIEVSGPGTLATTDLGGGAYGFGFSESGIYRVEMQARYEENGSGTVVLGEPVQLVFLAGLGVDYTYLEWADSYERTHGKTPGSLTDAFADPDGDGIVSGIEFQLFWHGFDPCVPDAKKLPLPRKEEGVSVLDSSQPETYAVWEFIRDMYKDDFANTTYGIAPGFSGDLVDWNRWYVFIEPEESTPETLFETSAEPDQDLGFIMKRHLRVPGDHDPAFFQFQLRAL